MSALKNILTPEKAANLTGIVTKYRGANRYDVRISEQKTMVCRSFVPDLDINSRVTINNTDAGMMIVGSGDMQSATANIIWIEG